MTSRPLILLTLLCVVHLSGSLTCYECVEDENETSLNSPTPIPTLKPLFDSSCLLTNQDTASDLLARQFEKDGYLFIRGLLDRQSVLEARR